MKDKRKIKMEEEIRKYKDTVEKMREERSSKLKNINSHLQNEIQEHKQTIETLKESDKKYRDLVEISQHLIWKCDEEGRFTFLNTA